MKPIAEVVFVGKLSIFLYFAIIALIFILDQAQQELKYNKRKLKQHEKNKSKISNK